MRWAFLRARFWVLPFALVLGLGAGLALWGQHTRDAESPTAEGTTSPADHPAENAAAPSLPRRGGAHLREGTEIRDVAGRLHLVDGRYEFVSSDGRQRLRMLENLALERAARKSGDSPHSLSWKVTGVVTEFEDANYLLVRRIVVEDAAE